MHGRAGSCVIRDRRDPTAQPARPAGSRIRARHAPRASAALRPSRVEMTRRRALRGGAPARIAGRRCGTVTPPRALGRTPPLGARRRPDREAPWWSKLGYGAPGDGKTAWPSCFAWRVAGRRSGRTSCVVLSRPDVDRVDRHAAPRAHTAFKAVDPFSSSDRSLWWACPNCGAPLDGPDPSTGSTRTDTAAALATIPGAGGQPRASGGSPTARRGRSLQREIGGLTFRVGTRGARTPRTRGSQVRWHSDAVLKAFRRTRGLLGCGGVLRALS